MLKGKSLLNYTKSCSTNEFGKRQNKTEINLVTTNVFNEEILKSWWLKNSIALIIISIEKLKTAYNILVIKH